MFYPPDSLFMQQTGRILFLRLESGVGARFLPGGNAPLLIWADHSIQGLIPGLMFLTRVERIFELLLFLQQ
jgi:hypothetical protein